MNKILGAAMTLMAVASTSAAFVGSEQRVPGSARPISSSLLSQDTGSDAYPAFDGASVRTCTRVAVRNSGSERYQDFAGEPALGLENSSRLAADDPPGLRFDLIGQPRQNGGIAKMHSTDSESLILVRLVWAATGTPVPNTKVTLLRVDMSPDGMPDMTARSYVRPFGAPGTYGVEVHPMMAGRWAVTLDGHMTDHPVSVRQVLTVALAK